MNQAIADAQALTDIELRKVWLMLFPVEDWKEVLAYYVITVEDWAQILYSELSKRGIPAY